MTPDEMRVLFEQKYQKKAQNRARGLTKYEVDIWLNDAQDSIVDEVFNGRTDRRTKSNTTKRMSDLESLMRSVSLPLTTFSTDIIVARLPSDYLYLQPSTVNINHIDKSLYCNYNYNTSNEYSKDFIVAIDLNNVNIEDIELIKLEVGANSTEMRLSSNCIKSNQMYKVVEVLRVLANKLNYELYWESIGSTYAMNTVFLATRTATLATNDANFVNAKSASGTTESTKGTLDIDFVGYTATITLGNDTTSGKFASLTASAVSIKPAEYPIYTDVHTRLSDRVAIHKAHPFKKTSKRSVLVDIKDGYIRVFRGDGVYPLTMLMDYVRRPRRINNELEISCELPLDIHREVVDLAVERLLQSVASQRYQSKVMDNQLNNDN